MSEDQERHLFSEDLVARVMGNETPEQAERNRQFQQVYDRMSPTDRWRHTIQNFPIMVTEDDGTTHEVWGSDLTDAQVETNRLAYEQTQREQDEWGRVLYHCPHQSLNPRPDAHPLLATCRACAPCVHGVPQMTCGQCP